MSSLIRFHYNPSTEFERLFNDGFNTRFLPFPCTTEARRAPANPTQPLNSFRPRMDVTEDFNTVTATFELPGLKPEDVTIDLQQDQLKVSGASAASHSHEEDGYAVRERRYGKFSRMLQLPFGTKPEDVKAKMENGLLTVTFPKAGSKQQPQRIPIQEKVQGYDVDGAL